MVTLGEKYVKWFRSNTEADEQFLAHEKLVDRMRGKIVGESNGDFFEASGQNLVEPGGMRSLRKLSEL